MAATFSAGGLISGMDWNSIIDKLVDLQQQPVTLLQSKQSAVKSQVSALGTLSSKLSSLRDATAELGDQGVMARSAATTPSTVGVTLGSDAVAGNYGIRVEALAAPAKSRSAGFAAGETVTGGKLTLTVMNEPYEVNVSDGASLESVAWSINHSGAPVSAVVLDDGTSRFLSITPTQTGFPVGGAPEDALSVVETSTGSKGKPLGITVLQEAANAVVHVDGIRFERQTNQVTGAIPGTTLSLKATSSTAQDLVIANDVDATAAKLQTFVDAYNSVIGFVQKQLAVDETSDRSSTLAGNSAVRNLQASLQQVISSMVGTDGNVRSLADLGLKTARDGSLSLDTAVLAKAIAADPRAVDEVFSTADTGVAALVEDLVDRHVDSDGILALTQKSLGERISDMDDEVAKMEDRIESYRTRLLQQFTAMENVVSGLKSVGSYLTALSQQASKQS
jgi:flagellar hook-associated protein 2